MGPAKATQKIDSNWDDGEYFDIAFAVHKSRRYHAKMFAFFDGLNTLNSVANALLGSAAFMALWGGKNTEIAQYMVGVLAAISAINTAVGFSRRARVYADLSRQFTTLASEIATWDPTEANLKKAISRRIKIEESEPPPHRLIDIQACNEEMAARGATDRELAPLSWLQRKLGYLVTFDMERLEKWRSGQRSEASAQV